MAGANGGMCNVRDHVEDHEMGKRTLKDLTEAVCLCVVAGTDSSRSEQVKVAG
jgi:hypothetical protein